MEIAEVVYQTSYLNGCSAQNLLGKIDNSQMWMSKPGLPQSIIFKLNFPSGESLSQVNINCDHAYSSNPSKILIQTSTDGHSFQQVSIFGLQFREGTQTLLLSTKLSKHYRFLELKILDTFGAKRTYMNKVGFVFSPNFDD